MLIVIESTTTIPCRIRTQPPPRCSVLHDDSPVSSRDLSLHAHLIVGYCGVKASANRITDRATWSDNYEVQNYAMDLVIVEVVPSSHLACWSEISHHNTLAAEDIAQGIPFHNCRVPLPSLPGR
jgi:hypothetical protein